VTGKEKHIATTIISNLIRFLLSLLYCITAGKEQPSPLWGVGGGFRSFGDGGFRYGWLLGGGLFLLSLTAMAQVPDPLPNPDWPLDSVIYSSVHKFTVPGDRNYDDPSDFVWNVDGGRLFYDSLLTQPSPAVTSDTVNGNAENATTMWVIWDSFTTPLDTGYVYVYEISDDGCQRENNDQGKYSGMRIKVSAPPDVWFAETLTQTCSYESGVNVKVIIDGMPPFDLTYSINGKDTTIHVQAEDLLFEGETAYINIFIDDYIGTTEDIEYALELVEASSGGVEGEILQPYHTVYAYRRPDTPAIRPDWTMVTRGEEHDVVLEDAGQSPDIYFWEIVRLEDDVVVYTSETESPRTEVEYNFNPGEYIIIVSYMAENGCESLPDSLQIEVFGTPTLTFIGDNYVGCSESSLMPTDSIIFEMQYEGALTYNLEYKIYDYNDYEIGGELIEYVDAYTYFIRIPNSFINDELPEIQRSWRIEIVRAYNEEGVEAEIIEGERLMIIHPKPIVHDDIDFAN
jgi:hypothetical protein